MYFEAFEIQSSNKVWIDEPECKVKVNHACEIK